MYLYGEGGVHAGWCPASGYLEISSITSSIRPVAPELGYDRSGFDRR